MSSPGSTSIDRLFHITWGVAALLFATILAGIYQINRLDDNLTSAANRQGSDTALLRSDTARQFERVLDKMDAAAREQSEVKAALARLEGRLGTLPEQKSGSEKN